VSALREEGARCLRLHQNRDRGRMEGICEDRPLLLFWESYFRRLQADSTEAAGVVSFLRHEEKWQASAALSLAFVGDYACKAERDE
jgi:hypothetical protein